MTPKFQSWRRFNFFGPKRGPLFSAKIIKIERSLKVMPVATTSAAKYMRNKQAWPTCDIRISNMHIYYYNYCTPERRGYWSRLSAIHEKPVVVRLESALTSDLKQPRTTVVITYRKRRDFPEQHHDSFPKTEILCCAKELREIVTDVRTLYE